MLITTLIENYKHLRAIAHGVLGNAELAEDVMQDAYLRVRTVVSPADEMGYLRTVVLNLALNQKRGLKSSLSTKHVSVDEVMDLPATTLNPDIGLAKLVNVRHLHLSVSRLPNKSRQMFEALLQDQTLTEYANSHNLNRNSMGPLYNYGLKQLKYLFLGVS